MLKIVWTLFCSHLASLMPTFHITTKHFSQWRITFSFCTNVLIRISWAVFATGLSVPGFKLGHYVMLIALGFEYGTASPCFLICKTLHFEQPRVLQAVWARILQNVALLMDSELIWIIVTCHPVMDWSPSGMSFPLCCRHCYGTHTWTRSSQLCCMYISYLMRDLLSMMIVPIHTAQELVFLTARSTFGSVGRFGMWEHW